MEDPTPPGDEATPPAGDPSPRLDDVSGTTGDLGRPAGDTSRSADDLTLSDDVASRFVDDTEPPAAPAEDHPEQRGRSGPLAALLQRSRRRRDLREDQPLGDLAALAQMHDQVLGAMRELIEAYGVTLRRLSQEDMAPPLEVALSAGPFASTEAVQRFVAELLRLESVREVIVRGYEGENRALLELQLAVPSA